MSLNFNDFQKQNIKFDISEKSAGTYTVKVMPEGITYHIVKQ